MDNITLKKKLSTYVSDKGHLKNVSDEVLCEILTAWENWISTAKEFYATLGFSHKQMAKIIGKAKRLKREGHFGTEDFKQIKFSAESAQASDLLNSTTSAAEIVLSDGKLIRFANIDFLLDYLKKIA